MSIIQKLKLSIISDERVTGILHFGSSIYSTSYNDIDILILIDNVTQRPRRSIITAIDTLRYNYLNSIYEEIYIDDPIKNNFSCIGPNFYIGEYEVVFVFGPVFNKNCPYIHIKGPLTYQEFDYFIQKFPFHGYSILQNSHWLHKSHSYQFCMPNITIEEYHINAEILESRFHKSTIANRSKIVRKFLIMNNILSTNFNINKRIASNNFIKDYCYKYNSTKPLLIV